MLVKERNLRQSFQSIFVFQFSLGLKSIAISAPLQSLMCCDNHTFQKWSFKENRNEMGMLTEGSCWDLIQFSASISLVKIHTESLLRKW